MLNRLVCLNKFDPVLSQHRQIFNELGFFFVFDDCLIMFESFLAQRQL